MNKTKIYITRDEFLAREDNNENGVSTAFAANNPQWEAENSSNKGCWNSSRCSRCYDCSGCYYCSRCSGCSDCSHCSRCSDCYDCSGCSDCYRCSDCYDCYRCSDCSDCSGCSGCSDCSDCSGCSGCYYCSRKRNAKGNRESSEKSCFIPKIPNIHATILDAVEGQGALEMSTWHTCETTHCRGGWVVFKAGVEGKNLEAATSTIFAAMQIYKASSPIRVSPVRFFETNEVAMAEIRRCAELEKGGAK